MLIIFIFDGAKYFYKKKWFMHQNHFFSFQHFVLITENCLNLHSFSFNSKLHLLLTLIHFKLRKNSQMSDLFHKMQIKKWFLSFFFSTNPWKNECYFECAKDAFKRKNIFLATNSFEFYVTKSCCGSKINWNHHFKKENNWLLLFFSHAKNSFIKTKHSFNTGMNEGIWLHT